MQQKTILCLITILTSGIPYAQAGRPSSTPQPAAPSNVPPPNPSSPTPTNPAPSANTPPSTDANNPQTANFSDTTLGKAALGTGVAVTGLGIGVGIKYGLNKKKAAEEARQFTDYGGLYNFGGHIPVYVSPNFEQPQSTDTSPLGTESKAYEILDKEQFNAAVKTLSETADLIKPTNPEKKHTTYKAELDRALGHLQKVTDHEAEHEILANSLKFLYDNVITAHGFQHSPPQPFTEHYQALKALHEHYEALRPPK